MDELSLNNDPNEMKFSLLESGSVKVACIANFLSRPERDALFAAVCKEKDAFQKPDYPGAKDDNTSRFLSMDSGMEAKVKAELVREATKALTRRIEEQLPRLTKELDVRPFKASNIGLSFIHSTDGYFGYPHADSVNGQYLISVLYYFNKVPKVYQGGELKVHESDDQAEGGYVENASLQIEPEDNLLVAFPSATFHSVTEMHSNSEDFEDGRFVVTMFIGAQ